MNFFKKLFGKTSSPTSNQATQSSSDSNKSREEELSRMLQQMNIGDKTPEMFENELIESLMRYHNNPDEVPEINIKNQDGEVVPPHIAFPELYQTWSGIQSPWDRVSVLFRHWDDSFFDSLEKWQVIERFTKDRYATKAMEYMETEINDEDLKDPRIAVALSKMYRSLDLKEASTASAKSAYQLDPSLHIVRAEYATALHLSSDADEQKQSHSLMNELVESRIKESPDENISLLNFFAFSPNYIDSSIYILMYLTAGKCDISTWEHLAKEYYHCPIFRFEHAVFLSQNGESIRSMSKLNSLADEFPWFKDGVLTFIDTIHQYRKQTNNPSGMEKELQRMLEYKATWN